MTEYTWRADSPFVPRVSAQIFGDVLEMLAGDDPPTLVPPKRVVDYARSRKSPIHKLFMWDDARAGERFRWMQARRYISSLEVVLVEVRGARAISTRGFWSVTSGKERGYAPRHRILSERDLKLQVIRTARMEAESFITKFGSVLTMGNIIPKLQSVLQEIHKEIARLEGEATKEKV